MLQNIYPRKKQHQKETEYYLFKDAITTEVYKKQDGDCKNF